MECYYRSLSAASVTTMTLKIKRASMLAVYPFQTGPSGIDETMLRVAMETPHGLVLVSPVLETHQRPTPLRRLARRFSAPSAILAGPVA
jgi:hypothetical protein